MNPTSTVGIMSERKAQVRAFIVDDFLFGDGAQLEDGTSFLDRGIIDSTGILELVLFLEETFDIEIGDRELVPENLDSLDAVDRFLMKKLS